MGNTFWVSGQRFEGLREVRIVRRGELGKWGITCVGDGGKKSGGKPTRTPKTSRKKEHSVHARMSWFGAGFVCAQRTAEDSCPYLLRVFVHSWFADQTRFPAGSIQFDHALMMRDTPHEWHPGPGFRLFRMN